MHNPQWAFAPLSGEGAKLFGGRFNIEGEAALYTSLDVKTAFMEASDAGATPGLVSPLTLVSYQVNIIKCINLTRYKAFFDIAWELQGDRFLANKCAMPVTWQVFKKAKTLGAEALIVPSYANAEGINMVLINWSSRTVEIHDPDLRLKAVYGEKLHII